MHRKSLEAAEQLKDDNTTTSNQSDKEGDDDDDNEEEEDDEEDDNDADDSSSERTSRGIALKHESKKSDVDTSHSHTKEDKKTTATNNKIDKLTGVDSIGGDGGGGPYQNGSPRQNFPGESPEEAHLRIRQEIQSQMEQHHAAVMQLAVSSRTDPEEFRNNSIACLRAKAQEHSAKIFSLSADALMFVNNNAAAAAAFLHRSSLAGNNMASHYDANANNLPNIHNYYQSSHQQPEMTNSDIVTSSDSSPIF